MRIGVITYYKVKNFGANLQAVSTYMYLKNNGNNVQWVASNEDAACVFTIVPRAISDNSSTNSCFGKPILAMSIR